MNKTNLIISTVLAAGIGIGSPVYAQVSETSGNTHSILNVLGDDLATVHAIIANLTQETLDTKNHNGSIMNRLELALSEAGINDFNSFCFITQSGDTISGVLIGGKIRITLENSKLKVEST